MEELNTLSLKHRLTRELPVDCSVSSVFNLFSLNAGDVRWWEETVETDSLKSLWCVCSDWNEMCLGLVYVTASQPITAGLQKLLQMFSDAFAPFSHFSPKITLSHSNASFHILNFLNLGLEILSEQAISIRRKNYSCDFFALFISWWRKGRAFHFFIIVAVVPGKMLLVRKFSTSSDR